MSDREFEATLSDDHKIVYNFLKTRAIEIARIFTLPGASRPCHVDNEADVREYVQLLQDPEYMKYAPTVISNFKFYAEIGKHRSLCPTDADRTPEMYDKLPIDVPLY